MKNDLFDTAIKDGNYISISEFSPGTGEKCGCFCPECGKPVQSNVTAKSSRELKINYTNRFSHIDKSSNCNGGYRETALHLLAKQVLSKNSSMKVPGEKFHYPETIHYTDVLVEKSLPVEKFQQYRPDIILTDSNGERIAVEIVVTNPVSEVKKVLYADCEFKCLVINLSEYERKDVEERKDRLADDILNNATIKSWIWPSISQDIDDLSRYSKPKSTTVPAADGNGCILTITGLLVLLVLIIYFQFIK